MENYQKIITRIQKNRDFRIALCSQRLRWFAYTYFGHYIKYPSAPFHEDIYNKSEDWDIKFLEIIVFRGSAKSTIANLILSIWAVISKKAHFTVMASDTFSQCKSHIYNLKAELDTNKKLIEDFGPFEENDEWTATDVVLPKYNARITARSTGQKVRGIRHKQYRPDLLIADDLESIESVRTKEGRDKTYKWFSSEVVPALEKEAKIVLLGNLLHSDCLMMKVKEQIEKGIRGGVLIKIPLLNEKNEIAWKGKYPTMKDIEIEKAKVSNNIDWQREYLLKIVPEEGQVVKEIKYYNKLPEIDFSFQGTGVDLAISKKDTAHYTSMVSAKLYVIDGNPKIYIMPYPVNERLSGLETTERARGVSLSLGNNSLTPLWVEDVSYQHMQIETMSRIGLPVKGIKVSTDKRARLLTVASYLENGTVMFPEKGCEDLIIQLLGFGIEKHDDLVDALVYIIQALMNDVVSEPQLTII